MVIADTALFWILLRCEAVFRFYSNACVRVFLLEAVLAWRITTILRSPSQRSLTFQFRGRAPETSQQLLLQAPSVKCFDSDLSRKLALTRVASAQHASLKGLRFQQKWKSRDWQRCASTLASEPWWRISVICIDQSCIAEMLVTAVSLTRAVRPLGRMSCEHSTKKSPAGRCSTFISLVHGSTCVPRPQLNICLLPGSAGNPRQRPNASTASASRLTQRSRMSFVNGEALYVVWSLPEYPVRWAVHQIR